MHGIERAFGRRTMHVLLLFVVGWVGGLWQGHKEHWPCHGCSAWMAGMCNNVKCTGLTGHVADEAFRPFSTPRRIVVVVGWLQE